MRREHPVALAAAGAHDAAIMRKKDFGLLMKSLGQARAFARGRPAPGPKVHAVRQPLAHARGHSSDSSSAASRPPPAATKAKR